MAGQSRKQYMHGYDAASRHMATRTAEQFADLLLPRLKEGMRVLDVGCGPGTITLGIAEIVAPGDVVGIDIAESEVHKAVENTVAAGIKNAVFEQGDATDLRFESDSFDAVFSSAAVEHVPDKARSVKEISRVLKPGGFLCMVSGIVSGHLYGPRIPETQRIMEIFNGLTKDSDLEPDFGLRQASLMHELGFIDIVQQPSYLDISCSDTYENRFRSEEIISRAERLGISNKAEMKALADRIQSWRNLPDHFMFQSWMKTLGRKPG